MERKKTRQYSIFSFQRNNVLPVKRKTMSIIYMLCRTASSNNTCHFQLFQLSVGIQSE